MTEYTWDAINSEDLPYRPVHSPITGEVFILAFTPGGVRSVLAFENPESHHRFLVEGLKLDDILSKRVIKEANEILRSEQDG